MGFACWMMTMEEMGLTRSYVMYGYWVGVV